MVSWWREALDALPLITLPAYDRPNKLSTLSDQQRDLFYRFYNGHADLKVIVGNVDFTGNCADEICFVGSICASVRPCGGGRPAIWCVALSASVDDQYSMFHGMVHQQIANDKNHSMGLLSSKTQQALALRLLHWALHRVSMPRNLCCKIVQYLGSEYKEAGRHLELCDVYQAACKWAISAQLPPVDIAQVEHHLAEALEATGEHAAAAPLYEEIVASVLASGCVFEAAATVRNNGGVAYKRAGLHDKAEAAHIAALRLVSADVAETEFLTSHYCHILNDITTNYWQAEGTLLLATLMSGLLLCAGSSARNGWCADVNLCRISVQVQGRARARRMLLELGQCPTPAAFRELLRTYQNPSAMISFEGFVHQDRTQEARSNAQREVNNAPLEANFRIDFCASCNEPRPPHACPCKRARYCSKECQRAHWKAHKADCPAHNKKKKEQQDTQDRL